MHGALAREFVAQSDAPRARKSPLSPGTGRWELLRMAVQQLSFTRPVRIALAACVMIPTMPTSNAPLSDCVWRKSFGEKFFMEIRDKTRDCVGKCHPAKMLRSLRGCRAS